MAEPRDAGPILSRRALLLGAAGLGASALAGCVDGGRIVRLVEPLNRLVLSPRRDGVRTYPVSAVTPVDLTNSMPLPVGYERGATSGWQAWRLKVDGLVRRPAVFTLPDLMAMPSVTQTTRLDCVMGWSAVYQWHGLQLAELLERVGLAPGARYVVCHAADHGPDGQPFYGSLDLIAARHPRTILAYGFGGGPLPVAHGAPLRLQLPTQLGYKSTKYIHRITLVDDLRPIHGGKGGLREDLLGYEWYAGI